MRVSPIAILLASFWGALPMPSQEMAQTWGFSREHLQETPPGFRAALTGQGEPGEWRIILDSPESAGQETLPPSPNDAGEPVLAQLSRDQTDERFPLLIREGQVFQDFNATIRFKLVDGKAERMGGLAFRIQDENNYYVVRASGLADNVQFYKFVDGFRSPPIKVEVPVPTDTWHELTVQCRGTRIQVWFNQEKAFPELTDHSFAKGQLGFWTKSDSIVHFQRLDLRYDPYLTLAEKLVQDTMDKYQRLLGLRIYARPRANAPPTIVAASDPKLLGEPGTTLEQDVIEHGHFYAGKNSRRMDVTLPLRDRNGDPVAAARFSLRTFPGQTRRGAIAQVMPIVKEMQSKVLRASDLTP